MTREELVEAALRFWESRPLVQPVPDQAVADRRDEELRAGWEQICADPRRAQDATRLMRRCVGRYSTEAALMTQYLGELVTLQCAPDMLALRLFPNGKEVTESFAAYDAVRYRLPQFELRDPGIVVVAVGDGTTPRTAATFALRSAWTCHSVDPRLKGGTKRWEPIRRLTIHARRIEECSFDADRAIVVAVHSHAPLRAAVDAVRAREVAVVAMPCCVKQDLDRAPDLEYVNRAVISPCRTILVWRNAKQ